MQITSPAFEQYQAIPVRYTCEGEDISVPLAIKEAPQNTASFAIIVEDPDAPKGTFDHWIAWNIPASVKFLAEEIQPAMQGRNGYGTSNYRGPCPPPGSKHRYFFRIYALDTILNLPSGSTKEALLKAMENHVLEHAELVGTFER